ADPLPVKPADLMGRESSALGELSAGDDAQVCSCNNVCRGEIREAIRDQGLTTVADVKSCTKAGAGCGGCLPLVTNILNEELEAAGVALSNELCEHFAYSRQELFQIVKVHEIKSFEALLESHGSGHGCEICKPAVASILASLWNDEILNHSTLQDTNDRFLANMQRGGLYSVVPRVPGGEITPEKLIVLGEVAKKFDLYTKITGGQRVDLFGARVDELPEIWEILVKAGFESGHAYGKALRTVKSCVGTTWCRYGVQDSVSFAIRIEKRYRGIRAPHKLKGAVSGCVRECAEAQCKDFGLVATEAGYNLYVCGNGGAKPRHADLLASDLDEDTCILYLDRFLMYYIMTADKLTRTASWLESLEGGLDQVRAVVIDDKLEINDELERRMQHLVDTYRCEWAEVVESPERRKTFRQFANSSDTEMGIELVDQRGQKRPADWPKNLVSLESITLPNGAKVGTDNVSWVQVGRVEDFPVDGGTTVKHGRSQIAVFRLESRGEWFATQNMCPHRNAFVLSRGICGDQGGVAKVACPLHKKTFSLESGGSLSDPELSIRTFPVRVEKGDVWVQLPPPEELDAVLATEQHCVRDGVAQSSCSSASSLESTCATV
ncbi:MAG: nitrite reductase small subunit NirD, partial [Planctomycetota bacterium]